MTMNITRSAGWGTIVIWGMEGHHHPGPSSALSRADVSAASKTASSSVGHHREQSNQTWWMNAHDAGKSPRRHS